MRATLFFQYPAKGQLLQLYYFYMKYNIFNVFNFYCIMLLIFKHGLFFHQEDGIFHVFYQ